jgi:hypothetical protein
MTDPQDEPTREDTVYAGLFALIRRYGFFIAIVAPLLLVSPFVKGEAFVLVVATIWLVEAIVYAGALRRSRGIRSGPGPALQALWVVFAVLLITGGLFGIAASGSPVAFGAVALGLGIVSWVWRRVARASGDDSRAFASRIGRTIATAARDAAVIIAIAAVVAAIGLPVIVVVLVAGVALATVLIWTLSRTLR